MSEKFSVLLVERGGSPYENPLAMEKKYYGLSLLKTDYFSSLAQSKEEDQRQCVEVVELLQQVVSSTVVTTFLVADCKKDILSGQDELSSFCKKNVGILYHGSCPVGSAVHSD
ncbi:hypothetical protein SAY86_002055 [Trapa natans]|uniref:Uncharacterized protein n=1 Tax=Trapa natans TaxID=22666 RepID=A0AAN7LFD4_TRANT|nr:hypothetical protein SAY86_002055 [Trapa natans]